MKNILGFVVFALFVACGESTSFSKIEDGIMTQDFSRLTKNENIIAQNILAQNANLIASKNLREIMENENLEIIATIPRGAYILGFIKGAKNFPFNAQFSGIWENDTNESQDRFKEFLGDLQNKIIFYDNGEGSAIVALKWAKELGYENVYYLAGNWSAWKERGYEISFDMPECCQM